MHTLRWLGSGHGKAMRLDQIFCIDCVSLMSQSTICNDCPGNVADALLRGR